MARKEAFEMASELIRPIVADYGLESYRVGASVFVSGTTVSNVDQHVDLILRVADWLLEEA